MFTHPPISHGKLIFYNISSFVDVFDFNILKIPNVRNSIGIPKINSF